MNPSLVQSLDFQTEYLTFSGYPLQPHLNICRDGRLKTNFSGGAVNPSSMIDYCARSLALSLMLPHYCYRLLKTSMEIPPAEPKAESYLCKINIWMQYWGKESKFLNELC